MANGGWGRGGIWGAAGAAWGCAALLFVSLLAAPAAAAEPRFARGSWELATGVTPSGLRGRTLGYFLADRVELVAHFADAVWTSLDVELPETNLLDRELEVDAAVSVPAGGSLAPYLGLGGRLYARRDPAPGAAVQDGEGTDLHGLAGLRVLVGRGASVNLVLRAGTRHFDDRLTGITRDGPFADLAVSLSRFF